MYAWPINEPHLIKADIYTESPIVQEMNEKEE